MQRAAASSFIDGLTAEFAPSRTLGNILSGQLARAIREGKLAPGDELPSEARLASAFGVSKQVTREAIRDLAALGVVEVRQGRVARVRKLDVSPLERYFEFAVSGSARGLAEACEFRLVLEPPIAGLAAIRRSAEGLALLKGCLDRMAAALDDIDAWTVADLDFHETVASLAGNDMLQIQIQALKPTIRQVMDQFNHRESRTPNEWRKTFGRHARIYEAIAAGDPEAATKAMAAHFDAAREAMEELFEARVRRTRD